MAEENTNPTIEDVNAYIAAQVMAQKDAIVQATVDAIRTQEQPKEDDITKAHRQIRDVIDPVYGDDIREAKFKGDNAIDIANFYRDPLHQSFQDEVEGHFDRLHKAGRPTSRNDIFKWMLGEMYNTDPTKLEERMKAAKSAQLAHASTATDAGSGSADRQRVDTTFSNFDKLSLEEMEAALDGVAW